MPERVSRRFSLIPLLVGLSTAAAGAKNPYPNEPATRPDVKTVVRVQPNTQAAMTPYDTTSLIQSAIDSCARVGGGRVEIAAGEYQVVPIEMRSNVELHLDAGAGLHFSRDVRDYRLTWIDNGDGPSPGVLSPIYGDALVNVAITGDGVIDGQGDAWRPVKQTKMSPADWDALVKSGGVVADPPPKKAKPATEPAPDDSPDAAGKDASDAKEGKTWFPSEIVRDAKSINEKMQGNKSLADWEPYKILLRPHLIRLTNCRGVKLEGVNFHNGAAWNVHLALCDDVNISRITVLTKASAQNGDGIDLDSCRNVTLADSTFNAGDDGICLKSGKDEAGRRRARPTENVTITRCVVGTGHGGVVIGSEMSGGVRNVNVSDCTFNGTDAGLRFKAVRGRGGVVENISARNITMTRITGAAVLFDLYYAANGKPLPATQTANETTPSFRNFDLRDITCESAGTAFTFRGLQEMPLQNIRLTNVTIKAKKAGVINNAQDLTFTNVHVDAADGPVKVATSAKINATDTTGVGE